MPCLGRPRAGLVVPQAAAGVSGLRLQRHEQIGMTNVRRIQLDVAVATSLSATASAKVPDAETQPNKVSIVSTLAS
jgi:hypothetical protein